MSDSTTHSEAKECACGQSRALTHEEFFEYADAGNAKDSGRVSFLAWKANNVVNVNSDDDYGSRICAERGTGDEDCDPKEAMADPAVLVIAIVDADPEERDAFSDYGYLGFYDVQLQRLYMPGDGSVCLKPCETCEAGRLRVRWTSVGCFKRTRFDADDFNVAGVHVLCLDMGDMNDISDDFAGTSMMEDDMQTLLRRLEAGAGGEMYRNIWVRHLKWLILQGSSFNDADAIAGVIRSLGNIFRMGEVVFPGAVAEAYAESDFLHDFIKPTRLPLFTFHLENGAVSSDLERLREKIDAKAKYADAQKLLDAAVSWPTSFRCTWVIACVQGALACSAAEKDEDSGLAFKRGRHIE